MKNPLLSFITQVVLFSIAIYALRLVSDIIYHKDQYEATAVIARSLNRIWVNVFAALVVVSFRVWFKRQKSAKG